MTIDEFMTDISPKMRPGWVVMNKQNLWWYFPDEPFLNTASLCWNKTGAKFPSILSGFDIAPVDDWTQSLRKVGVEWHI